MIAQLVRFVLGPLARALYRPEVHGVENVPATGQVLLAANHRTARAVASMERLADLDAVLEQESGREVF